MPPAVVHYGQAEAVRQARGQVLSAAYAAHPERFVRGQPEVPAPPSAVWINKPTCEMVSSSPLEQQVCSGDGAAENTFVAIGLGEVVCGAVSRLRQSASAEERVCSAPEPVMLH